MSTTPVADAVGRNYLGAAGAPRLLTRLVGGPARPPAPPAPPADPPRPATPPPAQAGEADRAGAAPQDTEGLLLDRHVLELAPYAAERVGPSIDAFPAGTLLLTNAPAGSVPAPPGTLVLTVPDGTGPDDGAGPDGGAGPDDGTGPDVDARVRAARPAHLRIVVDLREPALSEARWSAAARRLLRLHEWMFLAVRACAERLARPDSGGSILVSIVGGVTPDRRPTPFTGLFTGFVKSLALELPGVPVVATVHTAGAEPASAVADAAAELSYRQLLPVVYLVGGARLTLAARRRAAVPTDVPLAADALVVAAGGARGIGSVLLTAVAERFRPRMVLLGSTRLTDHDPALLEVDPETAAADRAGYIKKLLAEMPVAEANRRFERLQEARTVRRTLRELERHCGADRVRYVCCDLRDPAAVRAATAELTGVDLLLNIAGTNRAAAVATKALDDFRAVRDLKVSTYLNLKDAFADRLPRRWCNFGSFVGFTGQRGETDYGSANDMLNTAATASAGPGLTEFTIGWTLWRDVGLGATPVMRAFLAKSDQFTATPTGEGIVHFLRELGQPQPPPATVLFGDKERQAIRAVVPQYLDFCARTPAMPFVDRVVRDGDRTLTVARTFDLERDGYLRMHVVNGHPTLPGTFVPELAAEAARTLVPDRVPAVVEDVRLESFLRVYPDRGPQPKRIEARLVSEDRFESVVAVRVLGDVYGPAGQVLVRDRLHFSATVRLRDSYRTAPRHEPWADADTRPVRDPYHAPGSGVLLTGVFVSTTATGVHPRGRRARLALDGPQITRWFPDLLVPSVLLDGLARIAVLDLVDGRWIPVAIPRTIRRIEVFGPANDRALLGRAVELYFTPGRIDLEDPLGDNLGVAVDETGRSILEMAGTTGTILGYVDEETGAYLSRDDFIRHRSGTATGDLPGSAR
ncbi:hypothetical protein B5D80_11410 [Micromonospora wenchangensis]|uniref:PKS/mFAS DH domain-containing protein n=1 Tax=Micromonospora wenchangensis TaxID=1185415 RepID=A0A246RQ08_9ACTN|nr:KR domain-containing protein [Micromonospora wenchangensis]OWV08699.1 hypothetical protein B5D80_11410 [Micromonospora wenchangensis]